jgi:hypothetical protein
MAGNGFMTKQTFKAATLMATLVFASGAWARSPAPLIPTALVEDVKSTTADVEFMDYVGTGQLIRLQPRDVLVLSYLKSCQHETITGGTVQVGAEKSDVQGGKVVRARVACDGGKMQLTSQQANASGASAFRLQSVPPEPTLYALPPMLQVPKLQGNDSRTLVIERTDRPGERHEVAIGEDRGAFVDLATANVSLSRGATYSATLGNHKVRFRVAANAKRSGAKSGKATPAKTPIVSRLLRFPPG